MTRPKRFLVRMIAFLVVVAVLAAVLAGPLYGAFMTNPPLNGLILAVMLLGILYNFQQVLRLNPEVDWIETYRRGEAGLSILRQPKMLAPMATMLGERRDHRMTLSTLSMRSLLDGIQARLEESRDISRYLIGLLIFLGLLGTFWGLLVTVSSVSDVIAGLSVGATDFGAVFRDLKKNLEAPLSGMGTAFSSSLFGLAGSLALGFLDLQASQAQNRFYNDLEEWLSSLTRLSTAGGLAEDQAVPAYVRALLEQTAENLESLQRILARGEESRMTANANISALTERLGTLTDQMRTEQSLMKKLAESQLELKPILVKLAETSTVGGGLDEATRGHIRNLSVHAQRILEDGQAGREQIITEIRNEIKLLARTIAAIAEETER
ncbi:MAG: flagellar motor protein MotA [Proteobacteria bacterium]|nr:flagellar motor protein MotA [Pseudomonadota bacterium]